MKVSTIILVFSVTILVMAAVVSSREKNDDVASRLRQVHAAVIEYANRSRGFLPATLGQTVSLVKYATPWFSSGIAPSGYEKSSLVQKALRIDKFTDIRFPMASSRIMAKDDGWQTRAMLMHREKDAQEMTICFGDGRVEVWSAEELREATTLP